MISMADNRILLALPQARLEGMRRHLEPVRLFPGQVIYHPERPITHSYFITRGLASLIKTMRDGRTVEIGAIGTEGITGPDALFGIQDAILECIVQVPGSALRIPPDTLRAEMAQCDLLASLLERFVQVIISQIAQTAACNRLHSLEERCCRWLLTARDSARSNSFSLTHEFLAMMLGVQRTGVSLKVNVLRKAGLIRYSRGRMTIIDRSGLQTAACECYGTIREQVDRLFASPAPL